VDDESGWLRRFHLGDRTVRGTGVIDVRPAERWTGRVLGQLLRFPPAGTALRLRAAYLHDVGYAPDLVTTGFHLLDGARYLRSLGAGDRLSDPLVTS
jgi:hypothetical protein